jgi:hypothetical protein
MFTTEENKMRVVKNSLVLFVLVGVLSTAAAANNNWTNAGGTTSGAIRQTGRTVSFPIMRSKEVLQIHGSPSIKLRRIARSSILRYPLFGG